MRSRDLAEIAKDVRRQLKAEFPDCKYSVRIERYSLGQNMRLHLMEAPFQVFVDGSDHGSVNHYHIDSDHRLTGTAKAVLQRAVEIANAENWDNSDSMTDYFDVNYYFDLHVGCWDKPVVIKGAA